MTEGLLSTVRVVARKELVEILRDKRSLFVLLLLPVALYPLMFIGFVFITTVNMRKLAAKSHTVWVENLQHLPPKLKDQLRLKDDGGATKFKLELVAAPPDADYERALSQKTVAAVLRGVPKDTPPNTGADPPTVEILFNSGLDTSVLVQRDLLAALEAWKGDLVDERLAAASLPPETLEPLELKPVDKGPPGAMLAGVLAMMLVVLASNGAFYPALDLGAGEKERGTLETLLLAPVPRVAVAMGKFCAVFVVTFLSAVLHLISLGATFTSFAYMAPGQVSIQPDPWILPAMLLILLPLVALFSALALALATFAASYKEGQSYLTPVLILGTVPAMAAALPGMELTPAMCLVPVLGSTLLLKALISDTYTFGHIVLVSGSTFIYAGLAVRWVASLYESEEVLWRPAAAKGADLLGLKGDAFGTEPIPSLPQALALGVLGLLLLYFVGQPLQAKNLVVGLVITLVVFVAVPAVAYARLLGCDLRRTFRLNRPSPLALAAAVCLAVGSIGIIFDVMELQQAWTGEMPDATSAEAKAAEEKLLALGPVGMLLLMALLPGICEEILFRGFVLTGLRREGGTVGPVLVTALMFAIFHLDPGRLLPTFLLGSIMGFLVVRSGSIFPAMAMHVLYNGGVVCVALYADGLVDVGLLAGEHQPTWLLRGVGLVGLAAGIGLLIACRPVAAPGEGENSEPPQVEAPQPVVE